MNARWSTEELEAIGSAPELEVNPARPDGTLSPSTTIWVVEVGDELYVRSYRGPAGAWYKAARRSGHGGIRAGGVERPVTFAEADDVETSAVDDAYRVKYGNSGYVDAMLTPDSQATTLRLVPH